MSVEGFFVQLRIGRTWDITIQYP